MITLLSLILASAATAPDSSDQIAKNANAEVIHDHFLDGPCPPTDADLPAIRSFVQRYGSFHSANIAVLVARSRLAIASSLIFRGGRTRDAEPWLRDNIRAYSSRREPSIVAIVIKSKQSLARIAYLPVSERMSLLSQILREVPHRTYEEILARLEDLAEMQRLAEEEGDRRQAEKLRKMETEEQDRLQNLQHSPPEICVE